MGDHKRAKVARENEHNFVFQLTCFIFVTWSRLVQECLLQTPPQQMLVMAVGNISEEG